jgi:DNA-binding NarL/FixJ family response regulator
MINVLVVNKSRLMGGVVSTMLGDASDLNVVGVATNVNDAITLIKARQPDILLVSSNLPNNGALSLTQTVANEFSAKVVVMGVVELEEVILRYIEAGAAGYVLRADSAEDLLENIRAVYNGQALISPEISAALIARLAELAEVRPVVEVGQDGYATLTPREREVLDLISEGLNNQEIAERLVIEVGTVKNHVHNILHKLDLNSRYDAANYWDTLQKSIKTDYLLT